MTLRPRRSVLYLPASNARAIDKARSLPCDALILDLEDAVAPDAKAEARAQAVEAVRAGGWGGREVALRVNGLDTPWGEEDLAAAVEAAPDAVLVPKISDAAGLRAYDGAVCAAPEHVRLWAMLETAAGLADITAIARTAGETRLEVLVLGLNDLSRELRARLTPGREPFLYALGAAVAAARANGLAVIDGVFMDLEDAAGLAAECRQAADFGFDGKSAIHPSQLEACNRAFTPDAESVAWARSVIAAFAAPENAAKGAIRLDGRMVERLHLMEARRVLSAAEAAGL